MLKDNVHEPHMRTSLLIKPSVWKALKMKAVEQDKYMSTLISEILERELMR